MTDAPKRAGIEEGGEGRRGWSGAETRRTDAAPGAPYLVSVEEAGRHLGIGRTRAYRLVQSGYLKSVKLGRSRLVPVRAIEDLVTKWFTEPESRPVENAETKSTLGRCCPWSDGAKQPGEW
jgi:excisionase family DNA binding protein